MNKKNSDVSLQHILKCASYLKKIIGLMTKENSTNKMLLHHMKWIAENLVEEVTELTK